MWEGRGLEAVLRCTVVLLDDVCVCGGGSQYGGAQLSFLMMSVCVWGGWGVGGGGSMAVHSCP